MEGGFNFPFGGDPEDLMRGLREFAEQQAESVQEAQREQFATLTLNTAVELTAAALSQLIVFAVYPLYRRRPVDVALAAIAFALMAWGLWRGITAPVAT